ncbi:hypothetical protein LR68_04468 [Anoxybacillus sp. BCO1]|nr:hypothetical protein LR68_04468 [Anoxybacillus sp. BCO1]
MIEITDIPSHQLCYLCSYVLHRLFHDRFSFRFSFLLLRKAPLLSMSESLTRLSRLPSRVKTLESLLHTNSVHFLLASQRRASFPLHFPSGAFRSYLCLSPATIDGNHSSILASIRSVESILPIAFLSSHPLGCLPHYAVRLITHFHRTRPAFSESSGTVGDLLSIHESLALRGTDLAGKTLASRNIPDKP